MKRVKNESSRSKKLGSGRKRINLNGGEETDENEKILAMAGIGTGNALPGSTGICGGRSNEHQ